MKQIFKKKKSKIAIINLILISFFLSLFISNEYLKKYDLYIEDNKTINAYLFQNEAETPTPWFEVSSNSVLHSQSSYLAVVLIYMSILFGYGVNKIYSKFINNLYGK